MPYGYDWPDELYGYWCNSGYESEPDTDEIARAEEFYDEREDYIDKSLFPLEFEPPACVTEKKVDLADFGSLNLLNKINEDIIATVFYYHDSENIGDSKISFRNAAVSPNVTVVDGDRVMARRTLIFPNVYQHRVEPFELADKTKPGHRKILCFLLVDPNNQQTVATDKVPAQQQNLSGDKITSSVDRTSYIIPTENLDLTDSAFQYTISSDEAKKVREKLMKGRTPEEEDERGGSTAYTSFFIP
ncbi:Hypothetical protein PAS_chr2-1_0133 [Komagataella phaffii GS115]|uniref:DUF4246 domain-containing protein n=1 Tax=Komagataella phaffii (strain GS115 / ATCC 20864) TaxID=644223 RepID=C4QZR5_KOMPG|nr:Hypothetical protein PAS_chr2-1_0133 [Komagataella phaffii GS115]CAY68739.1 Hypothetical protein PAS_chr2-1_0133 [Komagataella phaffii GS115]